MSVAYSYPGIYIQELPLSTHTITPAPTSIAAFVGYTHPWKTLLFKTAIQLFSFSDYEANFGGLYTSGLMVSDVARAVYAFFLNGGTNCYVVGLSAMALGPNVGDVWPVGPGANNALTDYLVYGASIIPDSTQATVGIQLTAREPGDQVKMTASVTNLRASISGGNNDTFDLIITYGTRVEVYRSLSLSTTPKTTGSLDQVINGASSLVTVSPLGGGVSYGTAFAGTTPGPQLFQLMIVGSGAAPTVNTAYAASDFIPQFQANTSLDNVEIFNLLMVPGSTDNTVLSAALEFAERKRAFAILDAPLQASASGTGSQSILTLAATVPTSQNGALYFPWLQTTDPVSSMPMAQAPSGYVAGIYAATDTARGVWKAPAGLATSLLGTIGPVQLGVMNDMQQGVLNQHAINCMRTFTGTGTVVFGARTLVGADTNTAFAQSKYVPVRRMTLFIEQTLVANLKWAVFEPNDEPLWLAIRSSIEAFLLSLFNQGGLQGSTPSDAFQVKCDSSTTTAADQQNGIVNIVVAVALLKPAEFVIITISQLAGQTN
jgi:uncharacterized protein